MNNNAADSKLKELESYISFYEHLADRASNFISPNVHPLINVDRYFYMSISHTLDSIRYALEKGHASDAWTLLRKYHDTIITNIVYDLELDEKKFDFFSEPTTTHRWFTKGEKGKLFKYSKFVQKIADSEKTSGIFQLTYDQRLHDGIRDRCNNNAHINYFYNLLRNDPDLYVNRERKWLQRFLIDVKELFVFHICLTFILHEVYMLAEDFLDYLEFNMPPPPGCDTWPDMNFQAILYNVIEPYNPEAANYLRKNTMLDLDKTFDD